MPTISKIVAIAVSVGFLTLGSHCLYGKDKVHKKYKHTSEITIGFKTGGSLLFAPSGQAGSKVKKHLLQTNSIVLSKPLNNYFRIETGINYNIVQKNSTAGIGYKNPTTPYNITVPVTIQYYFLPEKHKLRPFIGAGFQYQYNLLNNENNPPSDARNNATPIQPGTKYVNILFTQGVTFEINTKIQISESIHFVPGSGDKMIGIDLGLGYKLP